jgi:hypothetical protein
MASVGRPRTAPPPGSADSGPTAPGRRRFAPDPEEEDEYEPRRPLPRDLDVSFRLCPRCQGRLRRGAVRCSACGLVLDEDEDGPPWGGSHRVPMRFDCEPHRGRLISVMGTVSVMCGALALCVGVPSLPGLALGVAAWVMGNGDLDKMRLGVMDPEGLGSTKNGRDCGIVGTVLSCLFGIGWLLYFAVRVLGVWW